MFGCKYSLSTQVNFDRFKFYFYLLDYIRWAQFVAVGGNVIYVTRLEIMKVDTTDTCLIKCVCARTLLIFDRTNGFPVQLQKAVRVNLCSKTLKN